MSTPSASEGSSGDDDEDFLPVVPELRTLTAAAQLSAKGLTAAKRPRSPVGEHCRDQKTFSNGHAGEQERTSNTEQDVMAMLSAEGYPCSLLYERSYRHGHTIQDVGTMTDENGALIATVDSLGVVRAWRKLPRGVFFMGEYKKFFSKDIAPEDSSGTKFHFIMPDPLNSCIFFVCVAPYVDNSEEVFVVHVEVSRVNCVLMAVEERFSFHFHAMPRNPSKVVTAWSCSFTPRPFMLYHNFQPYIAFFTTQMCETSGVVLVQCVGDRSLCVPRCSSTKDMGLVPSVSLSCVNLIVCCQQHLPSGLIVLVDEEGIVDYARVVECLNNEGKMVISLRVIGGVPSPGAADPLGLKQWITFERRQKTDFFAVRREVANAAKSGKAFLPLSVEFSPTGDYFVVSGAVLRNGAIAVLLHIFEFACGLCVCSGATDETAAPQLGLSLTIEEVKESLRSSVFNTVTVDASRGSPRSLWVFVPEIADVAETCEECIGGRRITAFLAVASSKKNDTGKLSFHLKRLPFPIGDAELRIRSTSVRMEDSSTFARKRRGGSGNSSSPLRLLRLSVPASQALKDIVAQSPVGCAFLHEDIKRIFAAPSATPPAGSPTKGSLTIADDPTFFTTSLSGNALLLYTKFEIPLTGVVLEGDTNSLGTGPKIGTGAEQQGHSASLLSELRAKRDFDCEDLLQLQSSLHVLAPRDAEDAPHENRGNNEGCEDNNVRDDELEEGRVRNIVSAASTRAVSWEEPSVRAKITVRTYGTISLRLLPQFAPKAVTNFTTLARRGFYDGLTFHRIVPGFMVQGGCPSGDGTGGVSSFGAPFEDEGVDTMEFFSYPTVQWLCMANRGPNTNESQFFITEGKAVPWLNGKHTVFGFVTGGKSVVLSMSQVERNAEDKPVTPVVIDQVTVSEGTPP